jgi:preprotein translocase subunit SecD
VALVALNLHSSDITPNAISAKLENYGLIAQSLKNNMKSNFAVTASKQISKFQLVTLLTGAVSLMLSVVTIPAAFAQSNTPLQVHQQLPQQNNVKQMSKQQIRSTNNSITTQRTKKQQVNRLSQQQLQKHRSLHPARTQTQH